MFTSNKSLEFQTLSGSKFFKPKADELDLDNRYSKQSNYNRVQCTRDSEQAQSPEKVPIQDKSPAQIEHHLTKGFTYSMLHIICCI